MIDKSIPAMPFAAGQEFGATLEAFALTYLAGYSHEEFPQRVVTSLTRAYGFNHLVRWPAVTNGRSGFVLAIWYEGTNKRVTIAIEGSRSWQQNLNWNTAYFPVTTNGLPGYVYGPFLTYAQEIYALLQANVLFMSAMADITTHVVVTGHSLGAAVADILSRLIKNSRTYAYVKLVKFASPRVGNRAYVNAVPEFYLRETWYCGRDPIDLFPVPYRRAFTTVTVPATLNINFAQENVADRYSLLGDEQLRGFYEESYSNAAQYARYATQEFTTLNPWWDHAAGNYRYMFTELAAESTPLNNLRFTFLEYPDENQWGLAFQPRGYRLNLMQQLVSPQPDPVVITLPRERQIDVEATLAFYRRLFETATRAASNPPPPPATPQPVIARVREMTRVAPATFQPSATGRRRRR